MMSIGHPQLGHFSAYSDTSCPHSQHFNKAIITHLSLHFILYCNILSLASIGNLGKNAKELNKFTSKKASLEAGQESFNLILNSLDNLDIDQAKKKLSDLKLNPNISKELLEAANNANLLTSSTEEVSKGIKSIGKQTSVLDKVKSAFSGLFSIVASHPFITAGVAIGAAAFAGGRLCRGPQRPGAL